MIPGIQKVLWVRFTWRHIVSAPVSSALLTVILAMGVAVFFAIRLANRAAVSSFSNFTDILTAESDGLISAPSGSLPEQVLRELRTAFGDTPVHLVPVLETTATRPSTNGVNSIGGRATFQILGVDLIAVQNLAAARKTERTWFGQREERQDQGGQDSFWSGFRDPRSVFVPESLAAEQGLRPGSRLALVINEQIAELNVAGVIPTDPSQPAPPDSLLVMDLPALQRLTARTGKLDRIEFVLPEGPNRSTDWSKLRLELERLAAGRWIVGTPADRRESAETMTQAFRLNLTVLSLLALVVGLYLVFQALDGAVVRRREEIAVLQALGVGPDAIRTAWLLEAAVLGLAGGTLGVLLGWAGAQAAVRVVGQTVNALYFATSAKAAALQPAEAGIALLLAIFSSVAAGWWPARQAATTPPAQLLGRGRATAGRKAGPWMLPVALGLTLTGIALCFAPPLRLEGGGRVSLAAYFAALSWLLAAGLFAGLVPPLIARLLRPLDRRRASVRIALSHLRLPTGRHRLAVAGLVCAVAMTAGMAILVGSFDTTMRGWIERTFMADLYVSSDGAQSASTQNRIAPGTWRALVNDPDVSAVNIIQATEVRLPIGTTLLVGGDPGFMRTHARLAWREEPQGDAIWDAGTNEGMALASESFSERFRLKRGDSFTLPTPSGPKEIRLAGIFSDYGNERGSLVIQREHFVRWFDDELASSIIFKLKPGTDVDGVRARWLKAHPGLAVYTNPHLRAEALRIFRQTFAITHALELIGVAVAVAGLGFALASLLWERRGDLTILRALGMRHGELAAAAAVECGLTALSGVIAGLAASIALGWLLIYRVNFQTFGWTLETDLPWRWLSALATLVLTMAVVTGWFIGRHGASLPAEREE
jgi:putative ABC transport system permease protein